MVVEGIECDLAGLASSLWSPGFDLFEYRRQLARGDLRVVRGLGAEPISVGQTEKPAESQIGIGRYRPLSRNDAPDPLCRYAGFLGEPVLADTHGFQEFLKEELARSNRISVFYQSVIVHFSVIIDDFDIVGGMIFGVGLIETVLLSDAPAVIRRGGINSNA